MPLLRITCPAEHTDQIVSLLENEVHAAEIAVVPGASRSSGGDLIIAEVQRAAVDDIVARLPAIPAVTGIHIAIEPSEQLHPPPPVRRHHDAAVIWAQVIHDLQEAGRRTPINVALIVIAAAIAAIGIMEDQLLLIVGAMALSPDYYPVADTCLAIVRRDRARVAAGARMLAVSFAAAIVGAALLAEFLGRLGIVAVHPAVERQFTLFISEPDVLSVLVAVLAGVAGALAVTLHDARGLVGVFVSITTIPAAANIGVAIAARDRDEFIGATVQLLVNVTSLLVAGTITLAIRWRRR